MRIERPENRGERRPRPAPYVRPDKRRNRPEWMKHNQLPSYVFITQEEPEVEEQKAIPHPYKPEKD
jgi:hypothetical protein